MDVEQTAFELVERWYASRAGVMANGESRDLLIAAVAAALREARAAGLKAAIDELELNFSIVNVHDAVAALRALKP